MPGDPASGEATRRVAAAGDAGAARPAAAGSPTVIGRGLGVLAIAVREEPRVFLVALAGSSLYALATVASSLALGEITERVLAPSIDDGAADWSAVIGAALIMVGIGFARAAGMFFRRLVSGMMQYRLQATYRRRVTRQYLRLPLAWHQRHSTGSLLSNANADVEATWAPIAPLPFAAGVLVMLAAALALLIATDPLLALVGCVVFPAFGVVNVVYGRWVSPLYGRAQRLRAEVSGVAHESFDGALVVKTLGREADETARFAVKAGELRDAMVRAGQVRGMFDPVMEALPNLGVLAVIVVGAVRIDGGSLTVGELVRVAYLFTLLAFPIRAIGWVFGELPRSVVGHERVDAVLTARGGLGFGSAALAGSGPAALRVTGVGYGYPVQTAGDHDDVTDTSANIPAARSPSTGAVSPVSAGASSDAANGAPAAAVDDASGGGGAAGSGAVWAALHGVTFDVAPGRVVALTGRTGAGKSTLVNLLARLVDPNSGTVRIDGVDLRDLAMGEVTRAVALVPQQTFLFDDTVRVNVALGLDVDDETVWEALRRAQAERFVRALPAGLDTRVGERGTTLSGGQRQRIGLARALVRDPRLLILDDATSSVDPRIESSILAGLRERAGASTVVIVAHRRSTVELADEVVHLEDGRVTAQGTHRELLASSPGYAELLTAYDEDTDAGTGDGPTPGTRGEPGPHQVPAPGSSGLNTAASGTAAPVDAASVGVLTVPDQEGAR
ncbi:ABC transporter ATP-binding protein/permease [Frankia sp. Mgl5]|uniref:ABC transporter ATP-binding protein n=1 Tax=Frankia sp. Mgl5 TaxID=2933793 RepID=UPI00200FB3B9|nr:ABC transporter ATP-binding protein [Frankia sp. Mgl5]MCK9932212.1 ABC transporter ATP-binding protein/permease [Frankia sp. Mgl5]